MPVDFGRKDTLRYASRESVPPLPDRATRAEATAVMAAVPKYLRGGPTR